jgi:hypothetical protein
MQAAWKDGRLMSELGFGGAPAHGRRAAGMTAKGMARRLGLAELRRSEQSVSREIDRHRERHGGCDHAQCAVTAKLVECWFEIRAWSLAFEWLFGLIHVEQLPLTLQLQWRETVGITPKVRDILDRIAQKEAA